ncbi:MAG: M24 family metallopeptidase [Oscillospiraceae bacterium]|jgi:Xaa-Pro aminopeptidase|nr:M24 family metallopeptidase [Oscillospiraceae bacterium]
MRRFLNEMDTAHDGWEMCAVTGAVSLFYFTGTVCNGVLFIRRGGDATLWVRRSFERALLESEFGDIRRMSSFRDVAGSLGALPDTLYLDTAYATLEWYALLNKYLSFKNVLPADNLILKTRAVKSEYELERMRQAGSLIDRLLREELPSFFRGGMSEAELGVDLFALYMKNGYHGVCRFAMRSSDTLLGHVAFGDSTLYPSVFNGASGVAGLCPAVPVLGSRERCLHEGDLIFIDDCFGIDGYHVDKTLVYSFKRPQSDQTIAAHQHCLELERLAASLLRTGARPSDVYEQVAGSVKPEYRNSFMGPPGRTVPFVGHSIGLYTDETPVIAKGFDDPLERGMTIAIEPKIGIEGIGMVGSENTYLVTNDGGICLTGGAMDILICDG